MSRIYHKPVLLKESLEALAIQKEGVYVDVTFGGGGHSRAILEQLGEKGKLIAFDQDKDAFRNMIEDHRFTLIHSNFSQVTERLHAAGITKVHGMLADLGVSSHQLDEPSRGFSFRFDEKLDMRMNNSHGESASELISRCKAKELQNIFSWYGEIRNAKTAANCIDQYKAGKKIERTGDLVDALKPCTPRHKESQYLAQIFQAIRIAVNNELENLKALLQSAVELIDQNGKLVVLTYHSLEDRLVKHFLQSGNIEGKIEKDIYGNPIDVTFKSLYRKALMATQEAIDENPRARSAKLRAGIRL